MNIDKKANLIYLLRRLVEKFGAKRITKEEFLLLSENTSQLKVSDRCIIYKIGDYNFVNSLLSEDKKVDILVIKEPYENNLDSLEYEYKIISKGKIMIVIIDIIEEDIDLIVDTYKRYRDITSIIED